MKSRFYNFELRARGAIEYIKNTYGGEIIDAVEGVLIDSLLIATKNGYIAMLETFETCNSSKYTVFVGTYKKKYDVLNVFNARVEAVEEV